MEFLLVLALALALGTASAVLISYGLELVLLLIVLLAPVCVVVLSQPYTGLPFLVLCGVYLAEYLFLRWLEQRRGRRA